MRPKLSLSELQAFVHTAETRNFRQAADLSCISQPALTRRIQSAENKLGVRLLDRDTRHVDLTEHGRALLPIAQRLVFEFQSSLSELSEFISGVQGNVTIACLPTFGAHFLPPAVSRFKALYPLVKLEFKLVDVGAILALLVAGQADFAISAPPPDGYDLLFTPLPVQDELVLLCACDDPLARQRSVAWHAVAQRTCISIGRHSSTAALIEQALHRNGVHVEPLYEVANIAVLGRMVASGLGVAIVSRLALPLLNMSGLRAIQFSDAQVARECGVLRLRRRALAAAASNFLEILASVAGLDSNSP